MEAKDTTENPFMKYPPSRLKLMMRCISVINKLNHIWLGDDEQRDAYVALLRQLKAKFDSLFAGQDINEQEFLDLEEAAGYLLK